MSFLLLIALLYFTISIAILCMPNFRIFCVVLVVFFVVVAIAASVAEANRNLPNTQTLFYLALVAYLSMFFAIPGFLTRAATLLISHLKMPRSAIYAVSFLGIGAAPLFVGTVFFKNTRLYKSASHQCLVERHPVMMGENQYYVPMLKIIQIHNRTNTTNKTYTLSSNYQLNAFCRETQNGIYPIDATKIRIRLKSRHDTCVATRTWLRNQWLRDVCSEEYQNPYGNFRSNRPFPEKVEIFARNHFGNVREAGSRSTYLEGKSRAATDDDLMSYVAHSKLITPDNHPLTAICKIKYANKKECEMVFEEVDGTAILIKFSSHPEHVESQMETTYRWTQSLLVTLRQTKSKPHSETLKRPIEITSRF